MSNLSSSSTGSTGPRGRGRVVGVPKSCWCGEGIVALISKSDPNPYRRYFRCGFAAKHRLRNDDHTFKWVDEALLNELETLRGKNCELELELKELRTERLEFDKKVSENVQMKIEKELFEKVEDALSEAKTSNKKMMIVVVLGCMIMIGFTKLVG
ncbi:uncharacterized protein At4g04775-like [Arabidopsis lyrata subsp. lyrata]|uniref:uncharacterized protein At4g04775-like n=1 Tax=Arabidopsis lyrata subsp. lyrata TaxID=81972 RepID=UPI000A29C1D5|nr:uncharacterized protein At4g04775-like [Arabidopsis lyrata subsp. lyrata]XP_020874679.1 uncharacterized protein At4g04775-like [Arabidopsis lyrata subsp. lyrata]XP_020875242.1 uncharacterized protein At4g04775-like [Arabidopsis lyrata subsp. lyrata]XP_020881512.1 uncharacterized protein At4g04775-like [Arabidopsis lyrata subsp. lyrata]|eukprot:XP_020866756.1 uncharacterized protein At4g04775-like [Arabidopsis lyrata subsp. lyrata]